MKYINNEPVRFILIGGLNTLLTYLFYLLLLMLTQYKVAYSVSFAAGIVLSYTLNTLFVFRQPWLWKKLVHFPLVYLAQYIAGLLLLAHFVERLHIAEKTAPLINVLLLLPLSFLLSKWIIRPELKHEI